VTGGRVAQTTSAFKSAIVSIRTAHPEAPHGQTFSMSRFGENWRHAVWSTHAVERSL